MQRKTKYTRLEVKMVDDQGTIEGYGNTFGNIDSYGDIMEQGAFAKTLADRGSKVKMLNQHDSTQVIGVWDSLSEDSTGLKVKGRINLDTQIGREAYSNLKMGCLDGLSIGYVPIQSNFNAKSGANHITEVKLYEVSLVTFPANEQSTVTAIKASFDQDFETLFDTLSEENRVKVIGFINNLKQSPLVETTEPPITEASVEKHSDEQQAGGAPNDSKPLADEDLHLLRQLLEALKQK
jgi:HK97 family phage prohead protease